MAELADLQAVHTAAYCVQVLYAWYPQDTTAVSHHMSTASAFQACVTRGCEAFCNKSNSIERAVDWSQLGLQARSFNTNHKKYIMFIPERNMGT